MKTSEPRERIKTAALILFGDKGYKSTTIRDICKKANVSLALVNYHFKNKQNLYTEIAIEIMDNAFIANPPEKFVSPGMEPEEKLRNTIRLFLYRLLGKDGVGKNPHAIKLIAKEMTNSSELMDSLYERYISRMMEIMGSAIKEVIGEEIGHEQLMRFISSIAGQCLHPVLAREVLARAGFVIKDNTEDIEKHAMHIYKFSINGLKGYKKG
ncbi:MAG: CerR family C-terminal domain-containing protein [Deferribacterales bacterium]